MTQVYVAFGRGSPYQQDVVTLSCELGSLLLSGSIPLPVWKLPGLKLFRVANNKLEYLTGEYVRNMASFVDPDAGGW